MWRRWTRPCLLSSVTLGRRMANLTVEQELTALKKQLKDVTLLMNRLKESQATNALVRLYSSRRLRPFEMKESLRIFSDTSFNAPIYCHNYLPVVLGHFITALDKLPGGLDAMPSILLVRDTLLASFKKLVACEIPVTAEQVSHFCDVLESIERTHAEQDLLMTMASAVIELKEHLSQHKAALLTLKKGGGKWKDIHVTDADIIPFEELQEIQGPMNFCNVCLITYNFMSRMMMRVGHGDMSDKQVGLVDLAINLESVVRDAVDEAKQVCIDHYGDCPEVRFVVSTLAKSLRFPYMRTTIHYVVFELMKNAFRATVDTHMKRNCVGIVTCEDMPPVQVFIYIGENTQHAVICISDEGNGMTLEALEKAMMYSYTTVKHPALEVRLSMHDDKDCISNSSDGTEMTSPLAGYGYGLPMSRVYAQSFGGDLHLQTMEGHGTQAFYFIKLAQR